MNDDPLESNNINIIGGPINKVLRTPNRLEKRRIIKADASELIKTRLIGGDCPDDNGQPPSIILEREGDVITKIIVKCVCGRHAELVCEEESEEGNNELSTQN